MAEGSGSKGGNGVGFSKVFERRTATAVRWDKLKELEFSGSFSGISGSASGKVGFFSGSREGKIDCEEMFKRKSREGCQGRRGRKSSVVLFVYMVCA